MKPAHLSIIIQLVLLQVKTEKPTPRPDIDPAKFDKIPLLTLIGTENFYQTVTVNRFVLILNKTKFNFEPWEKTIVTLEKFKTEAPKNQRLFFLIHQIIEEITSFKIYAWESEDPPTATPSSDAPVSCSLIVNIFDTLYQNNELAYFQNIISVVGTSVSDSTKEKLFFDALQDSLGQLRAYNINLMRELTFYKNLLTNQHTGLFLMSLHNELKKLSCLIAFGEDTLYTPHLISITQEDGLINCDMAIFQFSNPILIKKYLFNAINGLQLTTEKSETVHEIKNSLVIFDKNIPLHSLTGFKTLSPNCKTALMANDLLAARKPCEMLKLNTLKIFNFRPGSVQIFMNNAIVDSMLPYKKFDTAILSQSSVILKTKFGSGSLNLHVSKNEVLLPSFSQEEINEWDNIDEIFLLLLLLLIPLPLTPILIRFFKHRKKIKQQKILTTERNNSLLLLNTSYPSKPIPQKKIKKHWKISRQRFPKTV